MNIYRIVGLTLAVAFIVLAWFFVWVLIGKVLA
jgi:hypothetical protein